MRKTQRIVRRIDIESVDDDRPGRPLHLDALTGQLVQPAAADVDGRHHRRHLQDRAGEMLGHRGADRVERHAGHVVAGGHLAGASSVEVSTPSTTSPV